MKSNLILALLLSSIISVAAGAEVGPEDQAKLAHAQRNCPILCQALIERFVTSEDEQAHKQRECVERICKEMIRGTYDLMLKDLEAGVSESSE